MTLTQITEKGIKDGEIVNADINASAAIAKSKLASLDIVNADVNASAAIAKSKLASLDIVNADVNSSAAIAKEKLEDFVTGNSNNRLLTATGNTNSFIGESSFTYDGNGGLDMEGTGAAFFQIKTSDSTDGGVYFRTGSTNAGAISYLHNSTLADGVMSFRSGGTTKLTLKGNGNLGLGITSPAFKLESNGGSDDSVCFAGRSDGGNGNNARFTFKGYAHGGGANYGGGLKIQTRDTVNVFHDRLTIDSSGKVGIGNTSPTNTFDGAGLKIETYQNRSSSYASPDGHYAASLGEVTNSATKVWATVESHYAQASAVSAGIFLKAFHQDAGGSQAGFTMKNLKSTNDLTFSRVTTAASTGSPAVEAERLRIRHNGGITFNGDTDEANALDDYEEGVFTPTLIYQNTSGLTLATNSAAGKYTKIGRVCYIVGYINWSVSGSPINDNVGFGGLPFATNTGEIAAGNTRFIWNVTLGGTSAQVTHQMFPYGTNACALGIESEQGNRANELGGNSNMTARWQGWYHTE